MAARAAGASQATEVEVDSLAGTPAEAAAVALAAGDRLGMSQVQASHKVGKKLAGAAAEAAVVAAAAVVIGVGAPAHSNLHCKVAETRMLVDLFSKPKNKYTSLNITITWHTSRCSVLCKRTTQHPVIHGARLQEFLVQRYQLI